MLTLVTGVPGTGKTLWVITKLSAIKDRQIYYYGIPDLSPDLDWQLLSDPSKFHEEVPDGCIVVIDEVQKVFRQRKPSIPVPSALEFCEVHRHKGLDIYFITQRPTFLDHHARHLTGQHIHLHRNFGLNQATLYEFNRYTDIEDKRNLSSGTKSQFTYPKKTFGLYKSAEVHTHGRRLPKKLLLIPLSLSVVVLAFWFGYSSLFGNDSLSSSSTASMIPGLPSSFSSASAVKSADYWQNALTPVIPGLPHTAPLYNQLAGNPKTMPMIKGCISSADQSRCHCYTQQGTRIQMKLAQCLHFVENPYFDYTQEPPESRSRRRNRPVNNDDYASSNISPVHNLNISSGFSNSSIPSFGGYQHPDT